MIFDSELKAKDANPFENNGICQITEQLSEGKYRFALDSKQDLVVLDGDLIDQGINPYKVIRFEEKCNKVIMVDHDHIWLLYATGLIQRIQKRLFDGRLELQEAEGKNNYLVWQ